MSLCHEGKDLSDDANESLLCDCMKSDIDLCSTKHNKPILENSVVHDNLLLPVLRVQLMTSVYTVNGQRRCVVRVLGPQAAFVNANWRCYCVCLC